MTTSDHERLEQRLLEVYGAVIGGDDLWRVLGLHSPSSLKRHIRGKTLGLQTFTIPGRRGNFATARAVAQWVIALEQQGENNVT